MIFRLFNAWNSNKSSLGSRKKRRAQKPDNYRRPAIETLEDRFAPAAALSITPTTWNVIGLDSNNVNVGPNTYTTGVRVVNTGDTAASNVAVNFVWDSTNSLINLTDNSAQSLSSLAPGDSQDFYFTVAVTRNAAARGTARSFHITASADGVATVSTPTPRELYVERLISQNRNTVSSITGPTSVTLGQTYQYVMEGSTSTAYPQFNFAAAFPNTIFRIDAISSTYTDPAGATNDQFYADASGWDDDPTSATYLSSIGPEQYPGGKVGGDISTTVTVTIIGTGTATLTPMIQDYSGSSYHYNTNFGTYALTVVVATDPPADVAVTKTVSNPQPNVNDIVTFTLTVSNLGPNAAAGVQVTDQLPAGLQYVSDNGGGAYNSSTGVWAVGSLANGASASLQIQARVLGPTAVVNSATVSTTSLDPNLSNNTSNVGLTPLQADLSVRKVVDNSRPNVGDTVTFTLTATNNGPDAATGVRVTDLLPAGLQYVSDSGGGAFNAGTGVWTIGNLANGASATLTITALVQSATAATNLASVASDVYDVNPGNNTDTAQVTPQQADLDLTKVTSDATPNVGDVIQYTLVLSNLGVDDATAVQVTDQLPAGLQYLSHSAGVSYNSTTGVWTVGNLAVGASTTLVIFARVTAANPATNVATVSDADQFDPDLANNTASATLTPQVADLAVTKTVDDATPDVGQLITFTVTVRNDGPDMASNVRVVDALPAGLTFDSASATQGTYDSGTGVWTVGTLASGSSRVLTLSALVTGAAPATNQATASADQYDPDPADNTDSASVTPPLADLAVTKTISDPTPSVGDEVIFTLVVANNGPNPATNITIRDQLPGGVVFLGVLAGSDGSYDPFTGDWTLAGLAVGTTARLDIRVRVDTPDAVTNVATVTAADQYDLNPDNNTSTAVLTPRQADLTVTKQVNNATPNLADLITYTVVVSNLGPDSANQIYVTDPLPAGVEFVSAGGPASYDPGQGWLINTLAAGASVTLTLQVRVVGPGAIDNAATVGSTEYDPDPTNNTDSVRVTPLSSLLGAVFADLDNDGVFDAGEPGLSGVTLNLNGFDALGNPVNRTATTDAFGRYRFDGLPSSNGTGYTLTETQPVGVPDGADIVGSLGGTNSSNDVISGIVVPTGVAGTGYYFGELQAPNRPPLIIVPGPQTMIEGAARFFCFNTPTEVRITDPDVGNGLMEVTISAPGGTILLNNTSGLTFLNGTANGQTLITFRGTLSAVNLAVGGMYFRGDPDFNGSTNITITVSDLGNTGSGGPLSTTAVIPVTVTTMNDAPVLTRPGAQSATEDTPVVFSTANGNRISAADVDAGSSPVELRVTTSNGTATLAGTAGLTFSYGDGMADTLMIFRGSLTDVNAALDGLSFNPNANFAGNGNLTIMLNDLGNTGAGTAMTVSRSVPITFSAVNDAPVLTAPLSVTGSEDTQLYFSGATRINVTDDAGAAPIEMSLAATNGILTLPSTYGLTFWSGGNNQSAMTFRGTVSYVSSAISSLRFTPSTNYSGAASLSVAVSDLGNTGLGGVLTDARIIPITFTAVNDAPINSVPAAQTLAEDTALTFSTALGRPIAVADADAGAAEVQVALSATSGRMTLASTTGLTIVSGGPISSTSVTVRGTLADINAALDGLRYDPNPNYSGFGMIMITANDQGNTGAGGAKSDTDTVQINISAVNDAPVLSVPGTQTTAAGQDRVFSTGTGNRISISDVDASVALLEVTLTVTNGTLLLASTYGLTFVSGANGTATMTIRGSLTSLNNALNGLRYRPTAGFTGLATLSIAVSDLGNTGAGGALIDSDSIDINVTP